MPKTRRFLTVKPCKFIDERLQESVQPFRLLRPWERGKYPDVVVLYSCFRWKIQQHKDKNPAVMCSSEEMPGQVKMLVEKCHSNILLK